MGKVGIVGKWTPGIEITSKASEREAAVLEEV